MVWWEATSQRSEPFSREGKINSPAWIFVRECRWDPRASVQRCSQSELPALPRHTGREPICTQRHMLMTSVKYTTLSDPKENSRMTLTKPLKIISKSHLTTEPKHTNKQLYIAFRKIVFLQWNIIFMTIKYVSFLNYCNFYFYLRVFLWLS